MKKYFLYILLFAFGASFADTEFKLDYEPKRIIALEFSFVDALSMVDISPIGIADDKDVNRVLRPIREKIGVWTSVGMRSQPNLEVIASLKPDLIIADIGRHSAIFSELQKIAPTVLLPSRRQTYSSHIATALAIGKIVGKETSMKLRIHQHREFMIDHAKKLKHMHGKTLQFAIASKKGFFAHAHDSYAGGVIQALGIISPTNVKNESGSRQISLERLFAVNPEYLIVGTYSSTNVLNSWEKKTLWQRLSAVKNNRVFYVDGNAWSRARGVIAAEFISKQLLEILSDKH